MRIVFFSLILFSHLTWAQEQGQTEAFNAAEDPTRQLQNLVFYPHPGQFRLAPQFTFPLESSSYTDNVNGVQSGTSDASSYTLSLALTYGLRRRLRVGISELELFYQRSRNTNEITGVTATTESRGLSDPTFTFSYRAIESEVRDFYMDITWNVTPSLGTKKSALSGLQDGNNYNGGWTSTLSAPLFWVFAESEIELDPQLTRNFGSESEGTDPANSSKTYPHWTESVQFSFRYHFTYEFYLQAAITGDLPYTYGTANRAGATQTQHKSEFYTSDAVTLGRLMKSNFLLAASVTYLSHTSNTNPPSGANSTANTSSTTASVQGIYIF